MALSRGFEPLLPGWEPDVLGHWTKRAHNWLGCRDSNPNSLIQSQMSCRWTTSQCLNELTSFKAKVYYHAPKDFAIPKISKKRPHRREKTKKLRARGGRATENAHRRKNATLKDSRKKVKSVKSFFDQKWPKTPEKSVNINIRRPKGELALDTWQC